jgi:hypothetical protein
MNTHTHTHTYIYVYILCNCVYGVIYILYIIYGVIYIYTVAQYIHIYIKHQIHSCTIAFFSSAHERIG